MLPPAPLAYTDLTGANINFHGKVVLVAAIASAALGGVKMAGGVGKFGGALFGALIVAVINTMMNFAGNISTWWQNIIMGVLLLVSVLIQSEVFKQAKQRLALLRFKFGAKKWA